MRRPVVTYLLSAVAGLLAVSSLAVAQQGAKPAFDGKAFFEELSKQGFKSPAAFDGKKFFEDLSQQGYSDKKKLDGKAFFEELSKQGFSSSTGFDGKKFWDEQMTRGGYNMPPMVEMKN